MSASTAANENEQKARDIAKRNLSKIKLDDAKEAGAKVDVSMTRKLLRLMHNHGEDAIKSVEIMPNFDDGAAPHRLPSGYRMLFDASKSPVIAEAYPLESMYAGTMAFRIPQSELSSSPLSVDGPKVTTLELAKLLEGVQKSLSVSGSVMPDSYTGLFSHERLNNDEDYEQEYWLVTRSVKAKFNQPLATAITSVDRDPKITLKQMLSDTEQIRHETYSAQRQERAKKVSAALSAFHIDISADRILESNRTPPVIDNVFNALEEDASSNGNAALYCNSVPLFDENLSNGIVVTNTMRVGPIIMQGTPLGRGENVAISDIDAFPSSIPMNVSPWKLNKVNSSYLDAKCKRGVSNSPFTWKAGSSFTDSHPILSKNLYHKISSEGWQAFQKKAGFETSRSITLRSLAVNLASS